MQYNTKHIQKLPTQGAASAISTGAPDWLTAGIISCGASDWSEAGDFRVEHLTGPRQATTRVEHLTGSSLWLVIVFSVQRLV